MDDNSKQTHDQGLRGLAFPEESQADHFSGFNTLTTPFYGRGVHILFDFYFT